MRAGDALICGYCGKQVAFKWLFKTMHVCLHPDERDKLDRIKAGQR